MIRKLMNITVVLILCKFWFSEETPSGSSTKVSTEVQRKFWIVILTKQDDHCITRLASFASTTSDIFEPTHPWQTGFPWPGSTLLAEGRRHSGVLILSTAMPLIHSLSKSYLEHKIVHIPSLFSISGQTKKLPDRTWSKVDDYGGGSMEKRSGSQTVSRGGRIIMRKRIVWPSEPPNKRSPRQPKKCSTSSQIPNGKKWCLPNAVHHWTMPL